MNAILLYVGLLNSWRTDEHWQSTYRECMLCVQTTHILEILIDVRLDPIMNQQVPLAVKCGVVTTCPPILQIQVLANQTLKLGG